MDMTAFDINDAGQVAGYVTMRSNANETHAFTWSAESGFKDLQTLLGAGGNSMAGAITPSGTVYGATEGPLTPTNGPMGSPYDYAFEWSPVSGMKLLGRVEDILATGTGNVTSPGSDNNQRTLFWNPARGVQAISFPSGTTCARPVGTSDGHVIGYAAGKDDCYEYFSPFIWNADGTFQMIEDCFLSRFCSTSLYGINNRGMVTGGRNRTAFKWSSGAGFSQISVSGSTGRSINDNGDVAGDIFDVPKQQSTPFVWLASGEVITISLPSGFRSGYPTGINAKGHVVGNVY
jgi:probable HAF family extracellular repeat protein